MLSKVKPLLLPVTVKLKQNPNPAVTIWSNLDYFHCLANIVNMQIVLNLNKIFGIKFKLIYWNRKNNLSNALSIQLDVSPIFGKFPRI